MTYRDPDDTIRSWFHDGPDRGSPHGLEDTLARLATTRQAGAREIRMPAWLPLAAALAVLLALAIALAAGFRIVIPPRPPSPVPSSTTSAAGACRLDVPVHGRDSVLYGVGFAPDADVVIEFDRANGSHLSLDDGPDVGLRTDRTGGFQLPLRPAPEDIGVAHIVVTAGCSATYDLTVTAADAPTACPDPAFTGPPEVDEPTYASAVSADRPLAWWRFDDPGNLASDSMRAHGGTAAGQLISSALSPVSGGHAAYFLPAFAKPAVVELDPIQLRDDFTIEFWILFCQWADGDAIVGSHTERGSVQVGEGELTLSNNFDVVIWAGEDLIGGVWQHYAITRAGSTMTIYLGGEIDEQYPDTGWTDPFLVARIGADAFGDDFQGFLDEVALYDHALAQERVRAHAGAAPPVP
jgi:hypothetical protein